MVLLQSAFDNHGIEQIANDLPSLFLSERQLYDLELILNGGFFPLTGFLNQEDYSHVLQNKRLADGTLWPMPITLDIDYKEAELIERDDHIALRDKEGLLIAILKVNDKWVVNKKQEADAIFGTNDLKHPGVFYLFNQVKSIYLGGRVMGVTTPYHYDFQHLRFTPRDLRELFKKLGWEKIIAFQTQHPMHREHRELTLQAAKKTESHILIHPVVGVTKPGNIEYVTRVRCYEQLLKTYPANMAMLSLLPLAVRMAGPIEAVWQAIIRKNFGCTHFIISRNHADPGKNSQGQHFYPPYAAQQLTLDYQDEIGIKILPAAEIFYSQKHQSYYPLNQFPKDDQPLSISDAELHSALQKGSAIPEWFSYPAVIAELRKAYPLKLQQGFTLFLTGLPCAGKSTVAHHLLIKLREMTNRRMTLLDEEIIRKHLSQDLGLTRADYELKMTRVGFVAKEITKHGGIAICSSVAPFVFARQMAKEMIESVGGFIEIFVSTPLDICEKRDRKGYYNQSSYSTNISRSYEAPIAPDISINTTDKKPDECINNIIDYLKNTGYI